ncbi:MAG: ribonuclease HII [Deltaproteobacteria bacterium]|nr:MAG: ribonuclease HII [Deltaproteobacteria bacterium]PIE73466.1 MAG: ribonuclease HII [Deltaproteobacteria bacterium]
MDSFYERHLLGSDNYALERSLQRCGYQNIAGCDEVGRGPLAGPVVAAAVVFPSALDPSIYLDSKKLSRKIREKLVAELQASDARIGIGSVSEIDIDRLNILQASLLAMKLAVNNLPGAAADFVLVDGRFTIPLAVDQEALVKGESKSASIAAASIVAKVFRDKYMRDMHDRYPQYNFARNKGYPTREHRNALKKYGPCPLHRKSFKGVG